MKSSLSIFSLFACSFGVLPDSRSWKFTPVFSSQPFIAVALTFVSDPFWINHDWGTCIWGTVLSYQPEKLLLVFLVGQIGPQETLLCLSGSVFGPPVFKGLFCWVQTSRPRGFGGGGRGAVSGWTVSSTAFRLPRFLTRSQLSAHWGPPLGDECSSCCFQDLSHLGRRWSFRPRVVFLPLSLWLLVGLPFCSAHRNLRFWPFCKKLLLFLFIPQNHNLSWPIFRFTSSFFCLFKSVVNSSFHLSYFADAELLLVSLL